MDLEQRIAAVRRFNRVYTPLIGLLDEGYLDSGHSLAEVRVLYELEHRTDASAVDLARELRLDQAYLSRILRRLRERGLVDRRRSAADARRSCLSLTDEGRRVVADLERRSHDQVAGLLARLGDEEQERVVTAMRVIEAGLGPRDDPRDGTLVLRPPRAGDLGWVVERHGALYAREYGWDETFEGLVAEIVASFARAHDPRRERCWIAELDGRRAGCVFCVRLSDEVAQLRLLLVEPTARGRGIGRRLVDECVAFARSVGYRHMVLWTNDVLVSARRIYEAAGFRLVEEEPHRSFGHDLVGQNWQLELEDGDPAGDR